jgi:hypothetical protein
MAEKDFIDLTPRGMETPEGRERVKKAQEEYDNATREFAITAARFLDDYRVALIEMVAKEAQRSESIRDDWREFNDRMGTYWMRQDDYSRAVAGAPPNPTMGDFPMGTGAPAPRSAAYPPIVRCLKCGLVPPDDVPPNRRWHWSNEHMETCKSTEEFVDCPNCGLTPPDTVEKQNRWHWVDEHMKVAHGNRRQGCKIGLRCMET